MTDLLVFPGDEEVKSLNTDWLDDERIMTLYEREKEERMRRDEIAIVHEYARQQTVQELEKIRAEIEELIQHCDTDYDFEEIYGIRQAIKIIDKHISELKGENK